MIDSIGTTIVQRRTYSTYVCIYIRICMPILVLRKCTTLGKVTSYDWRNWRARWRASRERRRVTWNEDDHVTGERPISCLALSCRQAHFQSVCTRKLRCRLATDRPRVFWARANYAQPIAIEETSNCHGWRTVSVSRFAISRKSPSRVLLYAKSPFWWYTEPTIRAEYSPYDLFISLFRTAHPRYRPQPIDAPITSEMTQQNKTMNFLIHDANGKWIYDARQRIVGTRVILVLFAFARVSVSPRTLNKIRSWPLPRRTAYNICCTSALRLSVDLLVEITLGCKFMHSRFLSTRLGLFEATIATFSVLNFLL